MSLSKENLNADKESNSSHVTTAKKRRIRRNKLRAAKAINGQKNTLETIKSIDEKAVPKISQINPNSENFEISVKSTKTEIMSSKEGSEKTREDVIAAREAKKLAKQKAKVKPNEIKDNGFKEEKAQPAIANSEISKPATSKQNTPETPTKKEKAEITYTAKVDSPKSKDEVDRAVLKNENVDLDTDKSREAIKAERAAKKASKQSKKKPAGDSEEKTDAAVPQPNVTVPQPDVTVPQPDVTVQDVVNTLKDIANVAKEVQDITDKVKAIDFSPKKTEETTKSKAELKAERRAKQEAQRAAKQAAQQEKPTEVKAEQQNKEIAIPKEKSAKPKKSRRSNSKSQSLLQMNWFQHLSPKCDMNFLNNMKINTNLHPAVVRLGVQLASRIVTGSNARCIALLDALKKLVRDYSLPANTEYARGLEEQLTVSVNFLWSVRPPAASQVNALKYFRHHLTQLPNNVDEFDAKKKIQEEIDRYIREQIDVASVAISIAVRNMISPGSTILTYGCSSLISRILCEAHAARVSFRVVVLGGGRREHAHETLRRLLARGVSCAYGDFSALPHLMQDVSTVLLGASALLVNGAVRAAAGSLPLALAAHARRVPLLVACETHKFADVVQTDSFPHNEIGDPEDFDVSDENSPLKSWESNPNLTFLNVMYDVTPSSLITAIVTELAVLPCASAPVVLRFKLSEHGM